MLFMANLLGDVVHLCDPYKPVALQHPMREASVLPHSQLRVETGVQLNPDQGPNFPAYTMGLWDYLVAPTLAFKEIS